MADLLYDLLLPPEQAVPDSAVDRTVSLDYLSALASQPLASLEGVEAQTLSQSSHSLMMALQVLSKRYHRPMIASADYHSALGSALPALAVGATELRSAIPRLDHEALRFSGTYNKSSENELLKRRKQALLLARNVERLVDVLELPTLLSSAVSAAAAAGHSSALDLNGHIRRLHVLYPRSPLVADVSARADESMRDMAAGLILSLKSPGLKLAASLRAVSWLRRLLPDLEAASAAANSGGGDSHAPGRAHGVQERVLSALFLVCRLATLMSMLDALEPMRDLADQEKARQRSIGSANAWSGGQQTERYLKRYVEIFREQSFAIVSMFRSIFPPSPPITASDGRPVAEETVGAVLELLPPALATFPLYLVDMLLETLRVYLPTVKDQASRDSLLTQVLYCAGSLGRLGGDFGLFLADLDTGPEAEAEEEWVEVVRRHRQLAGRLESVVGVRGAAEMTSSQNGTGEGIRVAER